MTKYIKRKEAIEAMSDLLYDDPPCPNGLDCKKYAEAYLKDVPVIDLDDYCGNWIPVSEKLPTHDGDYLVTYEESYAKARCMAVEALQDDWIPVSEKEPSQTGEYLATAEYYDGVIFTDKFGYTPTTDGGWYDPEEPNQTHIDWNKFIIAWKPLPEPYKESEE